MSGNISFTVNGVKRNCSLEKFQDVLQDCSHLEYLDLSVHDTNLGKLPFPVAKLKNLRKLNMSECSLEKFPDGLEDCVNLEDLVLSLNTNLGKLPFSVAKLKNLRKLNMTGCSLEKFPDGLEDCVNLEVLSLSVHDNLGKLPFSVAKLKNLRKLDMIACSLEKFPDGLEDCVNLEDLFLYSNHNLGKLPFSVAKLKNLRKLDMSDCRLEKFPDGLEDCVNLEDLGLSFNTNLGKLPFSFPKLKNLRKLNMTGCSLEKFPDDLEDYVNLEDLDLSFNDNLGKLPFSVAKLKNLRRLGMTGCSLEKLPDGLEDCVNLEYLGLFGNHNLARSNESLKISELNANVYIEICTELNKPIKGKDYKTLAGNLGYHIKDVNSFQLKDDPADALLSHWGTKAGNDVEKLIAILGTMERDDLVEILGGKKESSQKEQQMPIEQDVVDRGNVSSSEKAESSKSGTAKLTSYRFGHPPSLSMQIPKLKDLQVSNKPWENVALPIDVLLLTVEDDEFLACFAHLGNIIKSHADEIGWVYFGEIGHSQKKVKVALVRSFSGSSQVGASQNVVGDAVECLKPKVVFSVGHCGGLRREKTKLGDVVISAKLTTYDDKAIIKDQQQWCGHTVNVSRHVGYLIKSAADGWKAPLNDPEALEVEVHGDAEILSGPKLSDSPEARTRIMEEFPGAVAVESEGQGLYAAAYNSEIEWAVIKGISHYVDVSESETEKWEPFACVMAASIVEHIFKEPDVLKDWSHYNGKKGTKEGEVTSKKPILVRDLDGKTRDIICQKLNKKTLFKKDFRGLAAKMKYETEQIAELKKYDNPTEALLDDWQCGKESTVDNLKKMLQKIKRYDVIEILDKIS